MGASTAIVHNGTTYLNAADNGVTATAGAGSK